MEKLKYPYFGGSINRLFLTLNFTKMSYEIILKENVLTDNILILPDNGKIFKGGYIAIIKEYVFLNAWNDKLIIKKFRKDISLNKYILKKYPNISILN